GNNWKHVALARAAPVFARKSRVRISRLPGASWSYDGFILAHYCLVWRATTLRCDQHQGEAPARRRTCTYYQAEVSRLFFDRLGHHQFLSRTQYYGPGPGQRRGQRGLLLPRDYAGRSGGKSSRLRTIPKREPERLAGYRSGSPQRRPARSSNSGNLSALRQTRRRDD